MFKHIGLLLLLGACSHSPTSPLAAMQAISDTDVTTIAASSTGHRYHILVRPPADYDETQKAYPVIYLLDGGTMFPQLAGFYHYLRFGDELPEAFIVGISYGSDRFAEGNFRASDYTAPAASAAHWGDAPQFAEFLADELLPYIESRYRVNADRRVLFGQSLGGQFVLYAAFQHADLFYGFVASNPALHRNREYFESIIPSSAMQTGQLIIAIGEHDAPQFAEPAQHLTKVLGARRNLPWQMAVVELAGESHFSAAPAAFRQGLRRIFGADGQTDTP